MKVLPLTVVLSAFSLSVFASCDSVKEQISQKIINNGVPESAFSLTVEPATNENSSVSGKIVGHCDNNTQVILYQKQDADSVKSNAAESTSDSVNTDKATDK